MSEEFTTRDAVELARQYVDAVNRRDYDAVEGLYAPDAVLRGAEVGRFDGAAAIRGLHEDVARSYEEVRSEIKEVVDLGNGVGFCVAVFEGRPVGSTGVVTLRPGHVVISGDGLIERQTNYMNIDQARADAERLAKERG